MTMRPHDPFDELISASLTGELTDVERATLDAHLDGCAACRATLASYAEGRRIVAGLRHVAPPRDLGARVRTGVERGAHGSLPWWRRPLPLFATVGGGLAAVAGALLAMVLLNGPSDEPPVAASLSIAPSPTAADSATPEPTPEPTITEEPQVTLPPVVADPSASASAVASSAPSATAAPTAPTAAPTATPSPEPDVFLAVTGELDNQVLSVQEPQPEKTPAPILEVPDAPSGPPVAAELSPDGAWIAYVTEVGERGVNEVRVTRLAPADGDAGAEEPGLAEGETLVLGESLPGGAFLERLLWTDDSRLLAFTLAAPEDGTTDVWVYDTASDEPTRLTDDGAAHAASWLPAGEPDAAPRLWVSVAGESPASYLVELPPEGDALEPVDVTEDPLAEAPKVFLPMLSPNGGLAIYWTGSMAQSPDGTWLMADMARPYLAEHDLETFEFGNERKLISDLTDDREMFTSAAIAWGPDGDTYAVWDAQWAGIDQGTADAPYPDPRRVYFGRATDPRGLTRDHALDRQDLPADGSVVDVKVSRTGRHLLVTVRRPVDGDLSVPRADLLLVTRNTGDVPDEVESLGWNPDEGWFGPAAFGDPDEDDDGS